MFRGYGLGARTLPFTVLPASLSNILFISFHSLTLFTAILLLCVSFIVLLSSSIVLPMAPQLTICHCKVNQTYRKFSTRTSGFLVPILGFGRRPKLPNKFNKHWLSGKGSSGPGTAAGTGTGSGSGCGNGSGSGSGLGSALHPGSGMTSGNMTSSSTCTLARSMMTTSANTTSRLMTGGSRAGNATSGSGLGASGGGPMHERPFQRHLAMNLENDMYYTVDFSENSQHSPLIQ